MSQGLHALPPEWTQPHPVLPLPTRQQVQVLMQTDEGRARLEKQLADRAELIRLEREDPLRYGYEPETFRKARDLLKEYTELLLLGANREGKTLFAAKYFVETLVKHPGAIGACFHSSERSSIDLQQPVIHWMLPPEWRKINKRERDVYLSYSRATGFSNFKFILPNKSLSLFFNYKQDVSVMEGYEYVIVWFDELVPLAFLEALAYRLGRGVKLIIIITFTPVTGYTPVVASYVGGASVLETRPAELLRPDVVHVKDCPPGHMPYVLRGRRPNSAVLCFHNGMNPFGAYREVRKKLEGAPIGQIKIRAYGWAEKMVTSAFAKFSERVHVITRNRWLEISKGPGTRYVSCDPGGSKNWFIKWYFVTPEGWVIVYREWPELPRFGEWALPPADSAEASGRALDWRPGPAQRLEAGRGLAAYKRLILLAEGWTWNEETGAWDGSAAEPIARRLIDPRMGGMEVPSAEDGTSIIEIMGEEQRDSKGRVTGPVMEWEPAPASRVDETIQMISDEMDYDETRKVDVLNCPRWYVVEDCKQSILAYQEFTAAGTERDALKDIIDPDRYFVKADCGYRAPGAMRVRRGGYY